MLGAGDSLSQRVVLASEAIFFLCASMAASLSGVSLNSNSSFFSLSLGARRLTPRRAAGAGAEGEEEEGAAEEEEEEEEDGGGEVLSGRAGV